jgi:hypothetical protein
MPMIRFDEQDLRMANFPVKESLRIVLNEDWQHRLYVERDLDRVETPG